LDCISTRTTSIGWFQAERPPPKAEARIFSPVLSLAVSSLPVKERMPFSLREKTVSVKDEGRMDDDQR
jgi:hypothetical protein